MFKKNKKNLIEKENGSSFAILFLQLLLISLFMFSIFSDNIFGVTTTGTEQLSSTFYQGDRVNVKNDGTIKVFNQLLKFTLTPNGTKIYVRDINSKGAEEYISVNLGTCDVLNYTRVCLDTGSSTIAGIRLFTLIPSFEISQYLDKDEIAVGEINSMRVDIENTGILACEVCHYEEIIPEDMEIINVYGADFIDNKIVWSGEIPGEDIKSIEYYFRTKNALSFNTSANLTYNNYIQNIELVAKAPIISEAKIKLSYLQQPLPAKIGHKTTVSFNISNVNTEIKNESINSMYVKIPEEDLVLTSKSPVFGMDIEKKEYLWAGKIYYNDSKEFWLEFIPNKLGQIKIPINILYSDEGQNESFSYNKELIINTEHQDLDIVTTVSEMQNYFSASEEEVNVTLRNIDSENSYSDVEIFYQNGFSNQTFKLDEDLLKLSSDKIPVKMIIPPVSESTQSVFKLFVKYVTPAGEWVNSSYSRNFLILPRDEAFIFYNISSEEIIGGDIIDVDVYVKSNTSFVLTNFSISQDLSDEFYVNGKTDAIVNKIEPYSTVKVLSYKIQFPTVEENITKSYNLISNADYIISQDTVENVKKVISSKLTILINPGKNSLIDSVFGSDSLTGQTIRKFISVPVLMILILSILLFSGTAAVVYHYKHEFGIPGLDTINQRESWIRTKKKDIERKESEINREQRKIDSKIDILKDFLDRTKDEIKKRTPISDEKKSQLDKRKEELYRQKQMVDEKIKELQEEELNLMKKMNYLETEKQSVIVEEKSLSDRYDKMKLKLIDLKKGFESLLEKESNLEKTKDELNNEEITLMKNKEKLLDSGSLKIINEKEKIVTDKITLEHEKNKVEEELISLKSKKEKIQTEQTSLEKQKISIKREINLFDSDKGAIEKSLKFLQSESLKLKEILDDMNTDENTKKKN